MARIPMILNGITSAASPESERSNWFEWMESTWRIMGGWGGRRNGWGFTWWLWCIRPPAPMRWERPPSRRFCGWTRRRTWLWVARVTWRRSSSAPTDCHSAARTLHRSETEESAAARCHSPINQPINKTFNFESYPIQHQERPTKSTTTATNPSEPNQQQITECHPDGSGSDWAATLEFASQQINTIFLYPSNQQ